MKDRKSLLLSGASVAVGIILMISGLFVSSKGIVLNWGGDNTAAFYEYTTVWYVGECMIGAGIIALILGVVGIVATLIREYLTKERRT